MFDPSQRIASELSLPGKGVSAVVGLLSEGSTVPFIARYRKEATGGLDEVQIRSILERREYITELETRRATVLSTIEKQGALTAKLRAQIEAAATKQDLEDLYLPYKPKRRTRAQIARQRGLSPLAERILAQPSDGDPAVEAAAFIGDDIADAGAALAGARDIAAEVVAEMAPVRALARAEFSERGALVSIATKKARAGRTKFEQYYDFRESVRTIPSHRYLAITRGEAEGALKAKIDVDSERLVARIERIAGLASRSPFSAVFREAIADSFARLISPSVQSDVRGDLKQRSDRAAIDVFGENLRNLLLSAPLGGRRVIGIDPGLRTGCKCAAVDDTGAFLETVTIHLAGKDTARAAEQLSALIERHRPFAIGIGNGTGGRETEAFARRLVRERDMDITVVSVNEAGASVYSASDIARDEFPDLDLTIRGAISIARRLQDPLAELVKLDPKAIGVGQYQHDVNQSLLQQKLADVVESCVNHVGVAINTASASLLSYVAGVGRSLAKKIVAHRGKRGAFRSRAELLKVSGLGPRAFEQAAGFLRVRDSEHPLDSSAVHPERYALVERIAADLGAGLSELVGNKQLAGRIDTARYVGGGVGEPTLRDIISELEKPGRDPRASFEAPRFRDDVQDLEDLTPGMSLEGVVTNVTAFGAFVDVGVHQDGLVHVSQLADRFVKDPADVVKVGDKIKVRVLDVDLERRRISLSARSGSAQQPDHGKRPKSRSKAPEPRSFSNNPFAKLED